MIDDGEKSEALGTDPERTEQASAAEIEHLVRASLDAEEPARSSEGRSIDDEDTATADPEAVERAALESAREEASPPSSEATPLSLRDMDAAPLSLRDDEALSMRDVEMAMAPGKAPPRRGPPPAVHPPAPLLAPKAARPAPRAPLRSRPRVEVEEAEPPSFGALARQSSGSIPPPKHAPDEELLRLNGGIATDAFGSAPFGVAPVPRDLEAEGPKAERPARTAAAPPRKKKPVEAAPSEGAREGGQAPGLAVSTAAAAVAVAPEAIAPTDDLAMPGPASGAPDADRPRAKKRKKPVGESAAVAAASEPPTATPATSATVPATAPPATPASSKALWWVGGAAIAAVAGYMAFLRPADPTQTGARSQEQHADVGPAPAEAPTRAESESVAPPETPPPVETAAPEAPTDTKPAVAQPASTGAAPSLPTGQPPAQPPAQPPSEAPGPGQPATAAPVTPPTTPPQTPPPAETAAPEAPAAAAPFDKSAANAALTSAVGAASGCKQPGDPSGVARVSVTFAPSGRVTQANVLGPPFAGTATGGCIARGFRSARVPAFEGAPVTVSKTVQIP